eukprot:815821-Alexandrium_andersonii.AAC.2
MAGSCAARCQHGGSSAAAAGMAAAMLTHVAAWQHCKEPGMHVSAWRVRAAATAADMATCDRHVGC